MKNAFHVNSLIGDEVDNNVGVFKNGTMKSSLSESRKFTKHIPLRHFL